MQQTKKKDYFETAMKRILAPGVHSGKKSGREKKSFPTPKHPWESMIG